MRFVVYRYITRKMLLLNRIHIGVRPSFLQFNQCMAGVCLAGLELGLGLALELDLVLVGNVNGNDANANGNGNANGNVDREHNNNNNRYCDLRSRRRGRLYSFINANGNDNYKENNTTHSRARTADCTNRNTLLGGCRTIFTSILDRHRHSEGKWHATSHLHPINMPTVFYTTNRQWSSSAQTTMNVFDRNAKRMQRNRSALNCDWQVYEYLKEEVGLLNFCLF